MTTLIHCGFTPDGRKVLGGAFQLADTMGFPLWASMDEAEKRGSVISIPHFFASSIEHGWDDSQAFGKIEEALKDRGNAVDFELIKFGCVMAFIEAAKLAPGSDAMAIGKRMREMIEG